MIHKWTKFSVTNDTVGIYEEILEDLFIYDLHCHIGKDQDGHSMSTKTLLKHLTVANVDKAVIFPLNDPSHNKDFVKPNEAIRQAWQAHPEKFIPFFRINPNYDWKQEFDHRVSQGFRGLKLHPRSQQFDITGSKAAAVYDACVSHTIPVLLHTGLGVEHLAQTISQVIKNHPKLKLILGHSGFVDLKHSIELLSKYPNVLWETSTLKIFDLIDVFKNVDYRKIVFGSDIPYYDIDVALQGVIDSAILTQKTANQIRHYLGLNAQRLFT